MNPSDRIIMPIELWAQLVYIMVDLPFVNRTNFRPTADISYAEPFVIPTSTHYCSKGAANNMLIPINLCIFPYSADLSLIISTMAIFFYPEHDLFGYLLDMKKLCRCLLENGAEVYPTIFSVSWWSFTLDFTGQRR